MCSIAFFCGCAYAFSITALPEIMPFFSIVIVIVFAGRFFQPALKRNNSTHFFNLPVTAAEKFVSAIIYLLICGIILHLVGLAGASIGHYLLLPLIRGEVNMHGFTFLDTIFLTCDGYLSAAATISVFLFASIYFKSKAFVKTLVSGAVFLFGFSIYFFVLFCIAFGGLNKFQNLYLANYDNSTNINIVDSAFLQNNYYILPIIIILFFLSLTYLRLKETEV